MGANSKDHSHEYDPEVWIFDYPDRFLVEALTPDDEYPEVFAPLPDLLPLAPYLVDLSENKDGACGCRDFQCNVFPYLDTPDQQRTCCKHILAARKFLSKFSTQPKQLPHTLIL